MKYAYYSLKHSFSKVRKQDCLFHFILSNCFLINVFIIYLNNFLINITAEGSAYIVVVLKLLIYSLLFHIFYIKFGLY